MKYKFRWVKRIVSNNQASNAIIKPLNNRQRYPRNAITPSTVSNESNATPSLATAAPSRGDRRKLFDAVQHQYGLLIRSNS